MDLIERQAAIELAMQYCPDDDGTCSKADEDIRNLLDELEGLPSAQPEIIRCKDCKWWKLSEYNTFGIHICRKFSGVRGEHDFCSRNDRKDDGIQN